MMMEVLAHWILRCLVFLILCFFILVPSTSAEDFLSIACCAESSYTDKSLVWVPDDQWFKDKKTCRNLNPGNERARIFDIKSGKICYNLPTIKDQDYLIRGSFPAGETKGTKLDSVFNVSIGVTPLALVNSLEDFVVEGIFRAVDSYTDFCLVQGKGDPYISSIELRHLNDSEYLNDKPFSILKLVNRSDLGGIGDTRFPEDKYDRIWKPASSLYSRTNSPVTFHNNASTKVPLKVLETAVTDSNRLEFLQNDLNSGDYNYTVILYFLELNDTVTRTGQRVFNIYINNERKEENFDILASGSNYREVVFNVTAKGSMNLTLVKVSNGSEFGPICNAFEIFQVRQRDQRQTDNNDVMLMKNVKQELLMSNQGNTLLGTWTGDPCLLEPWQGLTCNSFNGTSIITDLDLSSSGFQGLIPTSITRLTHLKTLNLSNNDFSGQIPIFSPSSNLTSVDISNNELQGSLPESLISLPDLKILYYGCNQLNNDLPSSLNSSKLSTDYGACRRKSRGPIKGIVIVAAATGSALVTIAIGAVIVCLYRQKLMARRKYDAKRLYKAKREAAKRKVLDWPTRLSIALGAARGK
ncbi:hypothetical protein CCACVL1_26622 [Corchorus capsularis]|uniref:Malectin-like domain-containing protein n=1 Tax=Corchorus capsularis TaxID=210143 RepID=A0A1R3GE04_COCAP|nr:hypothetical protein CCACVL1_26622 [Corchorus capsularis]